MLKPEFTGQFKRDYKLALKRGCDPKKLNEVVNFKTKSGLQTEISFLSSCNPLFLYSFC